MKDKRTVQQVIEANHKHFMKRGAAISMAYDTYVVAKDTNKKRVLLGGLGGLGVGQMWVNIARDRRHEDYSGWTDAEEKESPNKLAFSEARENMIREFKELESRKDRELLLMIAKKIYTTVDDPEDLPTDIAGMIQEHGVFTDEDVAAWQKDAGL